MSDHDDPVDAVILAFLDHREGIDDRDGLDHRESAPPPPTLDHLSAADRQRAETFLDGLRAARGIDPRASRPSVEALLVDTPLAGLIPALSAASVAMGPADGGISPASADPTAVARVLASVDRRARVDLDPDGATVVYSYLDLRARFLAVATNTPVITEQLRALVESLFDADPDTSLVGIVAAGSDDLMTQVLAADDVGDTITTPRGEPHLRWDPPLPLALAAARMLEQRAPEWPAFDGGPARSEPLDVAHLATEIARRVIEREAGRSYRGDKRRAYKALVGHERAFADLVARVCAPATEVDLAAETTRICLAAA